MANRNFKVIGTGCYPLDYPPPQKEAMKKLIARLNRLKKVPCTAMPPRHKNVTPGSPAKNRPARLKNEKPGSPGSAELEYLKKSHSSMLIKFQKLAEENRRNRLLAKAPSEQADELQARIGILIRALEEVRVILCAQSRLFAQHRLNALVAIGNARSRLSAPGFRAMAIGGSTGGAQEPRGHAGEAENELDGLIRNHELLTLAFDELKAEYDESKLLEAKPSDKAAGLEARIESLSDALESVRRHLVQNGPRGQRKPDALMAIKKALEIDPLIMGAEEHLSAQFGGRHFHRLEAVNLLSEIKRLLLDGEPSENQKRASALELVEKIESHLTAVFGSRDFHRQEAKRLLSELGSLLGS